MGEDSLILDNIYFLTNLIDNIEIIILLSSVVILPLPFIFFSGKKIIGDTIKYGTGVLSSYGATKLSQGLSNSGDSSGGNSSGGNSSGTNNNGQGNDSGSNSNSGGSGGSSNTSGK